MTIEEVKQSVIKLSLHRTIAHLNDQEWHMKLWYSSYLYFRLGVSTKEIQNIFKIKTHHTVYSNINKAYTLKDTKSFINSTKGLDDSFECLEHIVKKRTPGGNKVVTVSVNLNEFRDYMMNNATDAKWSIVFGLVTKAAGLRKKYNYKKNGL